MRSLVNGVTLKFTQRNSRTTTMLRASIRSNLMSRIILRESKARRGDTNLISRCLRHVRCRNAIISRSALRDVIVAMCVYPQCVRSATCKPRNVKFARLSFHESSLGPVSISVFISDRRYVLHACHNKFLPISNAAVIESRTYPRD